MKIGNWSSDNDGTYIIAEIGVNHNGKLDLAHELLEHANKAKTDAVKFQVFTTEDVISKNTEKASYQKKNEFKSDTQFDMVKKLELSNNELLDLKKHATELKLDWFASPFDVNAVKFLSKYTDVIKVPSGEIINFPLLREIGKSKLPVIMSRGMSNLDELIQSIDTLKRYGTTDIAILHCITNYPADFSELNLNSIKLLIQIFPNHVIGYSDHSLGISAPLVAVSLGARIIEKHFTVSNKLDGPDHKASLEPDKFLEMVNLIREAESSLGIPQLFPNENELIISKIARKSIVAKKNLKSGDIITETNIIPKRNNERGISPMDWDKIIGLILSSDVLEDGVLTWDLFK